MRKPTKRELMLVGVLATALVFTMSLDAGVKRNRNRNQKLRAQSRAQMTELSSVTARSVPYQPARMKAGVAADQWGLDPFDRAFTRESVVGDGQQTNYDGEVSLDGIMITSRGAAAMINGQVYRVGDVFDGFVVDSITKSEVVIRSEIDGTTTRLKVE